MRARARRVRCANGLRDLVRSGQLANEDITKTKLQGDIKVSILKLLEFKQKVLGHMLVL